MRTLIRDVRVFDGERTTARAGVLVEDERIFEPDGRPVDVEEVLAAATSVPARHFGLTDRGRIAPGLRADLLLVDGDPTRDITATRSVAGVWRRGVRLAEPRS